MTLGELRKITENYNDDCVISVTDNMNSVGWPREVSEVAIKIETGCAADPAPQTPINIILI